MKAAPIRLSAAWWAVMTVLSLSVATLVFFVSLALQENCR